MQRNSALLFHQRSLGILPQGYLRWLSRICCWMLLLPTKKGLGRKILVALHEKWEAALFSGRDVSGRGYDHSCPHSAIWWKMHYPKKYHRHLSIKGQHVEILKMELSLEYSRDSSQVSEGRPSTVLWLGHRRNLPSQQRLQNLVVTHAKKDSGAWFRSQLCHWYFVILVSQPLLILCPSLPHVY